MGFPKRNINRLVHLLFSPQLQNMAQHEHEHQFILSKYNIDWKAFCDEITHRSEDPPFDILIYIAEKFELPQPDYTVFYQDDGTCFCDVEIGDRSIVSTTSYRRWEDAGEDVAKHALDTFMRDPKSFLNDDASKLLTDYVSKLNELCVEKGWTNLFDYKWYPTEHRWGCDIEVVMGDWTLNLDHEKTFEKKQEAKVTIAKNAFEQLENYLLYGVK